MKQIASIILSVLLILFVCQTVQRTLCLSDIPIEETGDWDAEYEDDSQEQEESNLKYKAYPLLHLYACLGYEAYRFSVNRPFYGSFFRALGCFWGQRDLEGIFVPPPNCGH